MVNIPRRVILPTQLNEKSNYARQKKKTMANTENNSSSAPENSNEEEPGFGPRFSAWCWDSFITWGPALITVLVIRSVFAEPFRIPSGSMVPTLAIGDHILVTKYSYGFRYPLTRIPIGEPQVPDRGDVIVFVFPGSDQDSAAEWADMPFPGFKTLDYVKRVVGLPGESIEVKDNVVYINGQAQTTNKVAPIPFVDDRCRRTPTNELTEELMGTEHAILNAIGYGMRLADWGPKTVPDGHVYVMGDNRDHSADSRVWGFVPLKNIKGKARRVWLSYDQCETKVPIFGAFRGDRFGIPVK